MPQIVIDEDRLKDIISQLQAIVPDVKPDTPPIADISIGDWIWQVDAVSFNETFDIIQDNPGLRIPTIKDFDNAPSALPKGIFWTGTPVAHDPDFAYLDGYWVYNTATGTITADRFSKTNSYLIALTDRQIVLPSFTDKGDGTVFDDNTGLMWAKKSSWEPYSFVRFGVYNWLNAGRFCSALTLGGFDDWRMPTRKELRSIIDFSKYRSAVLSPFLMPEGVTLWTAEEKSTSRARTVNMDRGNDHFDNKDHEYYVLPVRGGR